MQGVKAGGLRWRYGRPASRAGDLGSSGTKGVKDAPIRGLPRDIGNAVVWLGSELSSFVTGTSLLVDGGYSTH
jgi:NAD(P)-dependent dehydrogenase (short-subunit alcohol dehydrogenase family)